MKEKLEAKLQQLNENKEVVQNQINEGTRLLRKAEADLNAIIGAIQVVNQLLDENADSGKTKETSKNEPKN
jgi:multidrug resistance efflux pump